MVEEKPHICLSKTKGGKKIAFCLQPPAEVPPISCWNWAFVGVYTNLELDKNKAISKGPWIRGVVTNLVEQIGALNDITNFLFFFAFLIFYKTEKRDKSRMEKH